MAYNSKLDRHLNMHGHVLPQSSFIYDECFHYPVNSDAYEGGVREVAVGDANTDVINYTSPDNTFVGVLSCKTGGSGLAANTRAGLKSDTMDVLKLGASTIKFQVRLCVPTLATGPEDFTVVSGLTDNANDNGTTSGNQNPQGIYIKYTLNTTNAVYGVTNGGTATNVTISATQDTSWHTYGFIYTTNGVSFFKDGTRVGQSTTNIPTAALGLQPVIIKKHAGTTNRNVLIDYYYYEFQYNSTR